MEMFCRHPWHVRFLEYNLLQFVLALRRRIGLYQRQAVDHLKSREIQNIIVGGGRQLGLTFVEEGLIDEIVLDIYPILFGNGTALLDGLDRCIQLELISSENLGDGAIRNHYKVLKQ